MPERIKYQGAIPTAIRVAVPADVAEAKRERDRFYHSARWRNLRDAFLAKSPINRLCAPCKARGVDKLATIVHHKQERLAHPELAYAMSNLEGVCASCHTGDHKRRARARR